VPKALPYADCLAKVFAAPQKIMTEEGNVKVIKRDGNTVPFDFGKLVQSLHRNAAGIESEISIDLILKEVGRTIYDGIPTTELERALILAASAYIERDPAYDLLTSRLYRQRLGRAILGRYRDEKSAVEAYRDAFRTGIISGIEDGTFTPVLSEFNLHRLADVLRPERDDLLGYIGIQTLDDRYLVRLNRRVVETPQAFWMRVATGLALNEANRVQRAVEFYEVLSRLLFVASTPTLFHSGLSRPQLSSRYLSTANDDLTHIFKCIGDNAQMSKWSGGIGNDWTPVRATGSPIRSTKVESQGVIPFLKIANDTTVAINRSGKRRGATCAYLETWHLDIEAFLDLRRNTGDERRRAHDMNTANWIPDLFMKRVKAGGSWTLFSPDDVPDLHDLNGRAFETRYVYYEQEANEGRITRSREVDATTLWRKMLTRLYETGHPWITFKDPSNIRSPQDHVGVVHNSNLCTEITLYNSAEETAVCNLGSINLARHVTPSSLDAALLERTVHTAIRMLDNVIDINFYPTPEAQTSNMLHRPVGLGLMGFQDALFLTRTSFASEDAIQFADETMEQISYHAILASSVLARERGTYVPYPGSKWDRGIFPVDTIAMLESERENRVEVSRTGKLDWTPVREHVRKYGMRNSNTMAVAPNRDDQ
jgi:ribonucleoside-diphosphate reductase alpha chain